MTWFGSDISIKDGRNLDAFNRLRVSNGVNLFSGQQEYTYAPLFMEHYTSGGTATHSTSTNSTILSTVDGTANNRAFRQTKSYLRYQPGKSQFVKITGTLAKSGTPTGAAVARLGLYDDNNGLFFCRDATGYCVVKRTNTSGSPVDTSVYQSSWNLDKMDGTGSSGITVDFTKEHIFCIDFQWLGVGRVRFGLVINGILHYVHEFLHANTTTTVYIKTANLPVRYEVFNAGAAGSLITMECVCFAVESEGGVDDDGGYRFSAATKGTSIAAANSATLTPILTLRAKDTFNSLTYRGHIHQLELDLSVSGQAIYYEVVWNVATLTSGGGAVNELTAGTWTDVDTTYSGAEYNIAATAYTGGVVIASGYAAAGSGASRAVQSKNVKDKLILARTYANVRDTITVVARGLGGIGTVYAALNFEEQY